MPAKNLPLRPDEREFIRLNCLSMTDEKIAELLNRDIRTVSKTRKKLGIKKGNGGSTEGISLSKVDETIHKAGEALSETQREEFYKTQFVSTLYYKNLKQQFSTEEIDFYIEEWGSLCVQFEDIVATEKRQIDEYIKISIMDNRLLKHISIIEQEIEILQKEIEAFRTANPTIVDDKELQEFDNLRMNLVQSMNAQAKSIGIEHNKNVELKMKLLGELNARRKDRVEQLKKRGTTFLSMVQEFRDRQVRENQGRHMELVRLAKEKKKKEWRRPTMFPDGTLDCVLLDSESELPKADIVLLNKNNKSFMVEKYRRTKNARILIVDNESRRTQFFGDVFKESQLDFASNADKAIDKLKNSTYDLICLDYDIGLDKKGDEIATFIKDNALCQNTNILVHSMNREGSEKITSILNSNNMEAFPFEEIVKGLGDINAKNSDTGRAAESDQPDAA